MADESGDDRPGADGDAADGDGEEPDPTTPDDGPAEDAEQGGEQGDDPAPPDDPRPAIERVDDDPEPAIERVDDADESPAPELSDDDAPTPAIERVGGEAPPSEDLFLDEDDPDAAATEAADAAAHEVDGGYGGDPFEDHQEYDVGEPTVEGAPDDEEMPLADHIEEMVKRLGVVVVVMAVVSGVVFPFADRLINFFWYSYLPGTVEQCGRIIQAGQTGSNVGAACPRVYQPLALILARLKVATLAGFVLALPVFVYETYLFMRPGLYPHERRYYLASVPTSLVLAAVGVAFAHFIVLPAIFTYFVYYSENATVIAFGLAETFDLMVLMMGGFAVVFQIPLFIMLALMMGLVTRRWMVQRRLLFWGAFAGIAFLFSPDPTGMAPFMVAATMIALFEGTLLLARWTGR